MFTFCPYTRNTAKHAQCLYARTRILACTRALLKTTKILVLYRAFKRAFERTLIFKLLPIVSNYTLDDA